MRALKALALLLEYPNEEILAATDEFRVLFESEPALPATHAAALRKFAEARLRSGLFDAQADYVALFDSLPGASLYLFQHLYGDSRDRGPALLELIEMYRETGLELSTRETADYLPVFLEFASLLPDGEARALLGGAAHVFEILRRRLKEWRSPYAEVFAALVALSASAPDQTELDRLLAQKVRGPEEFGALDREWEERPVEFTEKSAVDPLDPEKPACAAPRAASGQGGVAPCRR
jgi:nitrate reductase delta subunit